MGLAARKLAARTYGLPTKMPDPVSSPRISFHRKGNVHPRLCSTEAHASGASE